MADVPIVMNTSQSAAASARSTISGSSASPNHTTPGRIRSPQCGQRGGISGYGTLSSRHRGGDPAQPLQQRTSQIEPCKRTTSLVPARSWSPSTFCVISVKFGNLLLHDASTRCAGFGSHFAIIWRRQSYHSHTSLGSRAKACGVASVSGLKSFHSPPAPRNVGTPLAADTPAPVNTVMRASGVRRRTSSRLCACDNTLLLLCHELERAGKIGHHDV